MKGLETTMETKKFCQAPTLVNSGKGYRPKGWKNYGSMIFDGYEWKDYIVRALNDLGFIYNG